MSAADRLAYQLAITKQRSGSLSDLARFLRTDEPKAHVTNGSLIQTAHHKQMVIPIRGFGFAGKPVCILAYFAMPSAPGTMPRQLFRNGSGNYQTLSRGDTTNTLSSGPLANAHGFKYKCLYVEKPR